MKVLAFGGAGLVGSRFQELNKDFFEIVAPDISQVDILNASQIEKAAGEFRPDCIINFAAYTNVEEAEKQNDDKEGICYRINALGAKNVAEVCSKLGIHLIHISTEYVFDGTKENAPYTEEDEPNPINWYGKTKHIGDQLVLESGCKLTVMRISMPFTAHYDLKKDVARFFVEQLKKGNEVTAITDQHITPTLVDDIAQALKIFVQEKKEGLYHVSSKNSTTPFEFAKLLAQIFGCNRDLVKEISLEEYNKRKEAPLLKYSWLSPAKFTAEFGEKKLHTIAGAIGLFRDQG